jgi:adenosylmethionine-8-amino-7-oxononanoate aminotransferase
MLMVEWNTKELIKADKQFVWHPFTDMREWCSRTDPLLIVDEVMTGLGRSGRMFRSEMKA